MPKILREVSFTRGRIIVRGRLVSRGQAKRADINQWLKAQTFGMPPAKSRGKGR